jgi:hypothetical protein
MSIPKMDSVDGIGFTTVTKEEHSKKKNTPMEVTELGIDTANNLGDQEKA